MDYRKNKNTQIIISFLSFCFILLFAFWWFNPGHIPTNFTGWFRILDVGLFIIVSYVIWHPIVMEVLTWRIAAHIKNIRSLKPVPGLKVAFITTIVPKNEPAQLLHKCLPAMVRADYPHDTWVLDEGDNEEVKKICKMYGVRHFSRLGKSQYNTSAGKFTKTKGGNHNSWYEEYGKDYDFVGQIDTDFVPKSSFLVRTLGQFRDPKVAFVGTPQIYGNTSDSFIARGSFQQQFSFYGAVLRGLNSIGMTLMIGANHVVRVSAFKKVGFYTAHITEDLITGIKLHAQGWKSVYVPRSLATGEGPASWEAYFNQQLRWAYGCIDILFHHSRQHYRKMPLRQSLYYFFLQQHYFSGIAMAFSIGLLSLYFFFGIRAADVDLSSFFTFYSLVMLVCWLMSVWLQRYDIYRRRGGDLLLSGKLVSVAAWPIWFLAFVNVLWGKRLTYKVTPKGEKDCGKTPLRVFVPHLTFAAIITVNIVAAFFTGHRSPVMLFWAFSSLVFLLTIPFIDTIRAAVKKVRTRTGDFIRRSVLKLVAARQNRGKLAGFQFSSQSKYHSAIVDCLFLSIIIALSFVLYIHKIGFYSDDWSFLGNFTVSRDHSFIGLLKTATTANTSMRPLQNIYDVALYILFGTNPLGYQVVNAIIFTANIILFYFILRKIKLPRIIYVTVPLVFALLPNYSTDRFWYAAFQVNLSLLFFFISTYAGLMATDAKTANTMTWKCISIGALILSVLSYEVVLPLVFFNMVLFAVPAEAVINRLKQKRFSLPNQSTFIVVNFLAILYLIGFKKQTTTRLGTLNYPGDAIHLFISIFKVNFGTLGIKLPLIWSHIITSGIDSWHIGIGAIMFMLIFAYLYLLIGNPAVNLPKGYYMRNIVFVSFVIFLLGYAIFLTNNRVGFSPTGVDNRVTIAASIGLALAVVGFFGWLSRLSHLDMRSKAVFCFLVAFYCTCQFFVVNMLASYWVSAYQKSSLVLSDIKKSFPSLPKSTTLIVDGICPYVGPGVVFESQWDLKGALQIIYKDPTLSGDIVTPRLKVKSSGLETQIYTFIARYPYKNLIIYNFKNKGSYPIGDRSTAMRYFRRFNPDRNSGCPPASAGNGVNIF